MKEPSDRRAYSAEYMRKWRNRQTGRWSPEVTPDMIGRGLEILTNHGLSPETVESAYRSMYAIQPRKRTKPNGSD